MSQLIKVKGRIDRPVIVEASLRIEPVEGEPSKQAVFFGTQKLGEVVQMDCRFVINTGYVSASDSIEDAARKLLESQLQSGRLVRVPTLELDLSNLTN